MAESLLLGKHLHLHLPRSRCKKDMLRKMADGDGVLNVRNTCRIERSRRHPYLVEIGILTIRMSSGKISDSELLLGSMPLRHHPWSRDPTTAYNNHLVSAECSASKMVALHLTDTYRIGCWIAIPSHVFCPSGFDTWVLDCHLTDASCMRVLPKWLIFI